MQKVEQSILALAIEEAKVIPNGVDLSMFCPAEKQVVRAALGIPRGTKVLLFVVHGGRHKYWKDYRTISTAVAQVAERLHRHEILLIVLGDDAPVERIGKAEVRFVPYQKDPGAVASYYQVADVYLHAAKAEVLSTTVLESLACGTPVVATAVGGIPEQVKSLGHEAHCMNMATGLLVPAADAEAMAEATFSLLTNEALQERLGDNATRDARRRFDLEKQVEVYLQWYHEILNLRKM